MFKSLMRKGRLSRQVVFIVLLLMPVFSGSALGAAPGLANGVFALAVGSDGTVYAGGVFEKAGGVTVNNVAKWDGSSWSGLAKGTDAGITSLAVSDRGAVYIGGWFHEVDGKSISAVAKWDGKSWSAMPNKLANADEVAVTKDGSVYGVDGNSSKNLLKWTGSEWIAVGEELTDPSLLSAAADGSLYAIGTIKNAGNPSYCIARFDGKKWHVVAPCPGFGWFAISENGAIYYAERKYDNKPSDIKVWNGNGWTSLQIRVSDFNSLVTAKDGSLYAVKYKDIDRSSTKATVVKWDGKKLTELDIMTDRRIYALAVGPDNSVYIGGFFDRLGKTKVANIAKWDGVHVTPLGSGIKFAEY
jgi:hypothetical protein